jgi:hypothetical protein
MNQFQELGMQFGLREDQVKGMYSDEILLHIINRLVNELDDLDIRVARLES